MKEIDQNIQLAQKLYREEYHADDLPDLDRYNECLRKAADINNRLDILIEIMPWNSDKPVVNIVSGICDQFEKESRTGMRVSKYLEEYKNGACAAFALAENAMRELCPDKVQYLH